MFDELLPRDRETGNPLAGPSGAQRARIRWACQPGQPQGAGSGGAALCARLKTIQAGTEAGPTDTWPGN